MKRTLIEPILRWRDRHLGGHEVEDRAADLIRGSLDPDDPSPTALTRIEDRLLSRRASRSRAPLRLRLAIIALLLLVGATSVEAARRLGWLDRVLPAWSPTPTPPPPVRPVAKPRRTAHPLPAMVDLPAPVTEPAPPVESPAVASEPSPRPARITRRAPPEQPEAQASAPSDEIRALDLALRQLRRQRDPAAALASLDLYLDRYPRGVLSREARFARVDALLSLKRVDQALQALDALPLDNHHRSTELQVIRGELRARADCARAGQDFGAVLARPSDNGLVERALYGRGACRIKLGDTAGAAEDLRRYLELFPRGAHAAWARAWLEERGRAGGG